MRVRLLPLVAVIGLVCSSAARGATLIDETGGLAIDVPERRTCVLVPDGLEGLSSCPAYERAGAAGYAQRVTERSSSKVSVFAVLLVTLGRTRIVFTIARVGGHGPGRLSPHMIAQHKEGLEASYREKSPAGTTIRVSETQELALKDVQIVRSAVDLDPGPTPLAAHQLSYEVFDPNSSFSYLLMFGSQATDAAALDDFAARTVATIQPRAVDVAEALRASQPESAPSSTPHGRIWWLLVVPLLATAGLFWERCRARRTLTRAARTKPADHLSSDPPLGRREQQD